MVDAAAAPVTRARPTPHTPLHVLVSAYMCAPNRGSEPGKSWHWVEHLSAHCRVSVITQGWHRAAITAALRERPLPQVAFHYLDGPQWVRTLREGPLRFHMNYMLWQRRALALAQQIMTRTPFDLAHHVSFASIVRPIFLQHLPVPLIFGPVGGGELGHPAFAGGGGLRSDAYEHLRTSRMELLRWDPLVRSTLRRAAHIFLTTPENERFIPPEYRSKISVAPSTGIEVELTQRRGAPTSGQRIYTVGRLLHWKGFHLAIQAFARVARHFPDATFTIVGDGPQRARLQQIAVSAGVGERVHFAGQVPRHEALRIAEASDIFIFPSLHDSGGQAVLEAMALGKPVVCMDSGGPGVMVTPACGIKAPLVTPDHAVTYLSAGLAVLLDKPVLRQRMGQAARQRVLDEYIWERKAARMVAMYEQVVAAQPQPMGAYQ